MNRRAFLRAGIAIAFTACTRTRTPAPLASPRVSVRPARPGEHPYGALLDPDANGIRLPAGFRSRVVAKAGEPVGSTTFRWHRYPDGGAVFDAGDGGWIYVSNSEVSGDGGASAVRFDRSARIVDAYTVCERTDRNCAGGATPWGTWLSCEEVSGGRVWECDPFGRGPAQPRPALGRFKHEAVAVDADARRIYLTEDERDGRLYRFTPASYPSLDGGLLDALRMDAQGRVSWRRVPDPSAARTPARRQARESTAFDGGEGCWFDAPTRTLFFTTKGDDRIWALRVDEDRIEVLYDGRRTPAGALHGVDNVVVSASGDVVVAEDGGNMELVLITPAGLVAPLLRVTGQAGSELTGPAFDPSGSRLYFSSQRGASEGITYEVSGPFRRPRP